MRQLKKPLNKLPKNNKWCYTVGGYTFERNSLLELVGAVHNYLVEIDQPQNYEQLYAEIEDSICINNPHMPQYEKR